MNKFAQLTTILLLAFQLNAVAQIRYPETKTEPVYTRYFDTTINDNFRWLEDMSDPAVNQWLRDQSNFTTNWLANLNGHEKFYNELLRLYNVQAPSISHITQRGNIFFYRKKNPGESVTKIYVRKGNNTKERVIVDPADYSTGKSATINFFLPSNDGTKLAFGISENGKEIANIWVKDVQADTLYPERLSRCWFGISGWMSSNDGFLYVKNQSDNVNDPKMMLNARIMYHRVGLPDSSDIEIFSRSKYPQAGFSEVDLPGAAFSSDNNRIFIYSNGVENASRILMASAKDLLRPRINWIKVADTADAVKDFLTYGDDIYLLSFKEAKKFTLLSAKMRETNLDRAMVMVPEGKDKIEKIIRTKSYLYLVYTDGINTTLHQLDLKTKQVVPIRLPLSGTINVYPLDPETDRCIVEINSWNLPPTKFDFDGKRWSESMFNAPVSYPGSKDIVVEEVEVRSADGAMIPLSIFYNKTIKKNGQAACILSGYGSYGISVLPFFDPVFLGLVNQDVIVAIAHVRGGGEKGEEWRRAGHKTTKPNTWRDFITCAEYLVEKNYTSQKKIIAHGRSAGGITVGRAITERPELFGAFVDEVGLNNVLRFEQAANGQNNAREFGTVKDSVECRALIAMDAYTNVKKGVRYPPGIITTGLNDPRVPAWQASKFAAALQAGSISGKPVLLRVDYAAGHSTDDIRITARKYADILSFALSQCGHEGFRAKTEEKKSLTPNEILKPFGK